MAFNINRFTEKSQAALVAAQTLAERNGNSQVEPEHLLLALLEQHEGVVPQVLSRLNVAVGGLARQVRTEVDRLPRVSGAAARILSGVGITRDTLLNALREVRGSQRVTSANPEGTYAALEQYGRDLTQLARKGTLDPVIGRDEEIRRVIQVLSRRTKNNPVLIGEPGVGKTAVVEGLARRIVR